MWEVQHSFKSAKANHDLRQKLCFEILKQVTELLIIRYWKIRGDVWSASYAFDPCYSIQYSNDIYEKGKSFFCKLNGKEEEEVLDYSMG